MSNRRDTIFALSSGRPPAAIAVVRVSGPAETEAQRRQAFQQLNGLLGDRAERWRRRLTEALAFVEASIDFPDEDVVSEQVIQPALAMAQGFAKPTTRWRRRGWAGHVRAPKRRILCCG